MLLALQVMLLCVPVRAQAPACNPQMQCCAAPPGSGTPTCGKAAGNPLNTSNGNKFQVEVDMPALPGVLGLELVRYYNSELSGLQGGRGALGRGWRLSYDAQLIVAAGGQHITHIAPDGTHTRYSKAKLQPQDVVAGITLYRGSAGQGEVMVKQEREGYTLTQTDQFQYTFNVEGKLTRILAPSGHAVSLRRNANGQLLAVTDPQGRSLTFGYLTAEQAQAGDRYRGVQYIDSPVGRYSYHYGSPAPLGMVSEVDKVQLLANLVKVDQPSGTGTELPGKGSSLVSRQYHYEDPRWPTLLTGISVHGAGSDNQVMAQRLVTWGYDEQGRAVLSAKGYPARLAMQIGPDGKPGNTPLLPKQLQEGTGIEQVTLQFKERKSDGSSLTVLTNSLGQDTEYTYQSINGQKYLTQVRGAGCATCSPANQRTTYSQQGQVTSQSQLDSNGQIVQSVLTEYDSSGRPTQISQQRVLDGRPQPPQWQVRYRYANATSQQPSQVVRPSVVAGQEYQVSASYNPQGQLTQQTETGFSPLDGKGQIAATPAQASKIERTTRYTYNLIDNKNVLTSIDGPLANGPKGTPEDSDITTLEYDEKASYIIAMTQPGGFKSTFSYDKAGRIAAVKNAEGFQTTFSFDANLLRQISSVGPGWIQPNVQSYKYDALGRPVETGSGSQADKTYRPQFTQAFNSGDRVQWAASALGILQQNRYDTEGNLLQTSRGSNAVVQTSYNRYDELGRLQATWNNSGQGYALSYNAQGQVRSISDDMGRVTELLNQSPSPSVATQTAPSRAATVVTGTPLRPRKLIDDFGRTVAIASPDSGLTTSSFDAADRLIASTDAVGHRAAYAHDAAGRIIKQTIFGAATARTDASTSVTTWTYLGKRLVALEHPTQSERYEYDTRGLKIAKIVTLRSTVEPAAQSQSSPASVSTVHTAVTRYTYDEAGTLQSTSLPDGSHLVYQRNGQGQVVALKRSQLQTPWMQQYAHWLLPAQSIVQDLQRDIVGLKSYTAGNGVQAQFQRSPEGNLARIAYRSSKPAQQQTVAHDSPRPPPRLLLGRTTQETLSSLLGVRAAQAADVPPQPAASTVPGKATQTTLPGALGLPADPQAVIDHRYLWDTAGNLLYTQSQAQSQQRRTSYAYDRQDRLIIASQAPGQAGAPTGTAATPVSTTANQVNAQLGSIQSTNAQPSSTSRYYYSQGKRVLAQEGVLDTADLQSQTRTASYQTGSYRWLGDAQNSDTLQANDKNQASYNANGQPGQVGARSYTWDALGRLTRIQQNNKPLASYTYNHRGERIRKTSSGKTTSQTTAYLYESGLLTAELNEAGRITRQYIYLADMPIAVIDTPDGKALSTKELSAGNLFGLDLQNIVKGAWNALTRSKTDASPTEQTAWLHTNHLGAPEAATNSEGQLIWQAAYAPFGGVIKTSLKARNAFTVSLRLPGQYEDAETGLHYNKQRYYDPARGEYLSPDPLGTPDGPNGYAYVRYNPLKYVDPEGLILFAFDGTGNTNNQGDLNDLGNGISNVWNFTQLYNDGNARYVTGVGTRHRESDPQFGGDIYSLLGSSLDMGTNLTGIDRIKRMEAYFNAEAELFTDNTKMMDVDIIGFSRGAAQARDFANRINANTKNGQYNYTIKDEQGKDVQKCQMINFRFMGLWDTVLSTSVSSYDMNIVNGFQYVAQAVALNEYRGNNTRRLPGSRLGAFPLESVMGGAVPSGQSRVEMGFIGAHADIGGGFQTKNEIARVTLAWMVEQARDAGVKMNDPRSDIPANPIIHDKSDNQYCTNGPGCSEDRNVNGGAGGTQRNMTGTGMTYADTGQFISYYPAGINSDGSVTRTPQADASTGTVNMAGYLEWLRSNGYNLGNLQVR